MQRVRGPGLCINLFRPVIHIQADTNALFSATVSGDNARMDTPSTILIVDDDRDIRSLLADYLESNGYRALSAADGSAMWKILDEARPDLIVLDLNLPGDDGLTLCRKLRASSSLPVIMLTARNEPLDRILGLEMGADDYLPKPFEPRELLARIRSVLRRSHAMPSNTPSENVQQMRFSGWTLDLTARHLLNPDGIVIMLSGAEFRLLRVFLEHPNRVLNRDQLLNLTQGRDADPFDRSIDIQISRLRQKLGEDARMPQIIKTVRNGGYVLAGQVTVEPAA
jgi:two-component system OmpR family response regulator